MLSPSYKCAGRSAPPDARSGGDDSLRALVDGLRLVDAALASGRAADLPPLDQLIPAPFIAGGCPQLSALLPDAQFYARLRAAFACGDAAAAAIAGNAISFAAFSLCEDDLLSLLVRCDDGVVGAAARRLAEDGGPLLFRVAAKVISACARHPRVRALFPGDLALLLCRRLLAVAQCDSGGACLRAGLKCVFFFSKGCAKEDSHTILTAFHCAFPQIVCARKCYKYFCCTCTEMIERGTMLRAEFDAFGFIDRCIDTLEQVEDEKMHVYSLLLIGKYLSAYGGRLGLEIWFFVRAAIVGSSVPLRINALWVASMLLTGDAIAALLESDAVEELARVHQRSALPLKDEIALFLADLILVFTAQGPCAADDALFARVEGLALVPLILESVLYNSTPGLQERVCSAVAALVQHYGERARGLLTCDQTADLIREIAAGTDSPIVQQFVTFVCDITSE